MNKKKEILEWLRKFPHDHDDHDEENETLKEYRRRKIIESGLDPDKK